MPDMNQYATQDPGLDKNDGTHVVLSQPTLASQHLAAYALGKFRAVMRAIPEFEATQPKHRTAIQ